MPETTRLLARLFFGRFLENDLISPDADRHQTLAVGAACIISFGLVVTMLLAIKYLAGVPIPGQTALTSLDDKFLYIGWSMLVMGLVTLAEWDALALDIRDASILGPLPIAGRTIFQAKAAAVLVFAAVCAVAVNLVPSVIFPSALVAKLIVGPVAYLTLISTHAAVTVAAGAFGFFSVLALREVLHALLGTGIFRRVSAALQALLVMCFVTALCLMPGVSNRIGTVRMAPETLSYASPPLWFLGLYETAAGHVLDELPRTNVTRRLRPIEDRATATYRSRQPAFHELATIALGALGLAILIAAAAFSWNNRELPSPVTPKQDLPHRVRRLAVRLSERWIVRRPLVRSGFFFTFQTLWRSGSHRLTMAIAIAVALAFTTVELQGIDAVRDVDVSIVPLGLLAIQPMVILVLFTAFRHAARVPGELRANWAFQMSWNGDPRPYIAGVKRAALLGVACPALFILFPLHMVLLGWRLAAFHWACGLCLSVMALEIVMLGFRTLPFASSYVGGGSLKAWLPVYLIAFIPVTRIFARIERAALSGGAPMLALLAGLVIASVAVRLLERRQRESYGPIDFYELPAQSQRLDLSA